MAGDSTEVDLLTDDISEILQVMSKLPSNINFIRGFVDSAQPMEGEMVDNLRRKICQDYGTSVFATRTGGTPPQERDFRGGRKNFEAGSSPGQTTGIPNDR